MAQRVKDDVETGLIFLDERREGVAGGRKISDHETEVRGDLGDDLLQRDRFPRVRRGRFEVAELVVSGVADVAYLVTRGREDKAPEDGRAIVPELHHGASGVAIPDASNVLKVMRPGASKRWVSTSAV